MANRKKDVDALLIRSQNDITAIEESYQNCLHAQCISTELKIDIKNLCENLRSVLDYIAHDIHDEYCSGANSKSAFYFPILPDNRQFQSQTERWFPGVYASCPDLWDYLESIQPYNDNKSWLGKFNRVNNENKHESIVEQTRMETQRVNVSFGTGSVSWDPNAVKFGSGVFIGGVPVDPQTQMPVPHQSQKVEKITWVDFQFDGINESALTLLKKTVAGILSIVKDIYKWL